MSVLGLARPQWMDEELEMVADTARGKIPRISTLACRWRFLNSSTISRSPSTISSLGLRLMLLVPSINTISLAL